MGKKVDLNKKNSTGMSRNKLRRNYNQNHSNSVTNTNNSQNETQQKNKNEKEKALTDKVGDSRFNSNSKNDNNEIDEKGYGTIKMPIKRIVMTVLIILLPIFAILFVAITVVVIFDDDESGSGIGMGGYYTPGCNEITVIFVDKENGYEPTGTETYSLEDYVAGVVYAEVGLFQNLEIYKLFSIAARTYGLENVDESCTIESSDRKQVFKDITGESNNNITMIYEAVNETEGKVFLMNNELYSVRYDAFCSIEVDDNYYTIQQQNQKIPVEWVENQKGIIEDWKQGTCKGNHGMGISQYGAYYLASEQDYNSEELAQYYFKEDEVMISTMSMMTSIAGLDVKYTETAIPLNQLLSDYLKSKGSSIEEMNNFIENNVEDAGKGSREGVVTAAVSLINFLYDNFNVKLPYYWGGQYQYYGADPNFGSNIPSTVSVGGNIFYYTSFDCSGFVSWAIKNGGYIFSRQTTYGFDALFSKDSCDITNSNCVGQPGDLINSANAHVQLIVAVDEEAGKYMIAESSNGVVMTQRPMHTEYNKGEKILRMDNFYNDENNIDQNY